MFSGFASPEEPQLDAVSYYRDIRPILQEKCHGCHQPAKAGGEFVMTSTQALLAGGSSGQAIVPHKPDESYLVEQITAVDGEAAMPLEGDPLSEAETALVRKWIAQGASDDTPSSARQVYDAEHLPQYTAPPVVTSLDYSPDGQLLAIAGFHEVLLHHPDGSGLVARLVGLSERIESACFSPDGKWLAVTAGSPARMGEVQIWDVATRQLKTSVPVGFDTLYGASWSPDGSLVSFGLPDNTLRVIRAETGQQVLFMGGHHDWVLDTVFSLKGDHLVSVSRDMTAKLTHVETERFIDNITSITPGALTGGINSVARHPGKDEILVGGADGVPRIYRLFRETERRIGDDANLVRQFPPLPGRIWSVAYSPDGKRVAAGSSLNEQGWVHIYSADFDSTTPELVKKAFGKVASERTPEEMQAVAEYHARDVPLVHAIVFDTPVFAVAFDPSQGALAAAGGDGTVRIVDLDSGSIVTSFDPVPAHASPAPTWSGSMASGASLKQGRHAPMDRPPPGLDVVELTVTPSEVVLDNPHSYQQALLTGRLASGELVDLTRQAAWHPDTPVSEVDQLGTIRPSVDGRGTIVVGYGAYQATVAVEVSGLSGDYHPDFIRDVMPIISRLGCNAGTCHGSKNGKNGFKLSLRGYDPLADVRALVEDHAARRVNLASPDDSLMLLKATGAVPHEGGVVTERDSHYYGVLREWIADGARFDAESRKVARIELFPTNPVLASAGGQQQFRVVAHYPEGTTRDVTHEAILQSGNTDVATADDYGLVTAVRRGEAAILARYEGAYAATTLTVMGDREGFEWQPPETWGRIDELVADKWQRLKLQPSELCTDSDFLRRVYLDLTGLPPSGDEVRAFLADSRPVRAKRDEVIDRLIGSAAFVDHWTNKWADMLQVNAKYLGTDGARLFREWIRVQVEQNTPYDRFVYAVLTATGSNKEHPEASYFKILRAPDVIMENTMHLFLATRFNCNKCHDHPFERWTQDQYYQTAAYFAHVALSEDADNSQGQRIGGSDVESAKPLYEIVADGPSGDVIHERTRAVTPPAFAYDATFSCDAGASRRVQLASWLTARDNPYFATSYVNRLWGYLLGVGIIDPLDDIRAGNPPTNRELLEYLTEQFVEHDFDVRHILRLICTSRTYQLSIETNRWNQEDTTNFSHALPRRLPAEVLFDAVHAVTGSQPRIPGVPPGTRAAQLADPQVDVPSGLLANLGRPPRESACECERASDVQLASVMSLLNDPAIAAAIADPENALARLVELAPDDDKVIEEVFLRILNRPPSDKERAVVLAHWAQIADDHEALIESLAEAEAGWAKEKAKRQAERLLAIRRARADIDAYRPEHQRLRREAEEAQRQRTASAETALRQHEARVPELARQWESQLGISRLWTEWQPLKPRELAASGGIELKLLDDDSVLASGNLNAADYTLTIDADSVHATGFMVEALPHDELPGFGPGLNPDGNFVVTEVQVDWHPSGEPTAVNHARFAGARADHNQDGFDVAKAINGDLERNDTGWAVAGQVQRPHWARFQLAEPITTDGPTTLVVRLYCRYGNGDYPLGCFRLWLTDSAAPLELGLPRSIAEALKKPPEARGEGENQTLQAYVRDTDGDYLDRRHALAGEKRPLPPDAKMVMLETALAQAERSVEDDPRLVRLRQDCEQSVEQLVQRRLTAAQDLAWALINNSAFLFNR
jgi:WD40 repeat protein